MLSNVCSVVRNNDFRDVDVYLKLFTLNERFSLKDNVSTQFTGKKD